MCIRDSLSSRYPLPNGLVGIGNLEHASHQIRDPRCPIALTKRRIALSTSGARLDQSCCRAGDSRNQSERAESESQPISADQPVCPVTKAIRARADGFVLEISLKIIRKSGDRAIAF